eukprot:CAMPEP_0198320964 /NCGR_PEP_ID=MMETSP1450-20131203/9770_1 /TAXON_ID=753684 ORGANISM="Madagascaria erythrocladiodes, Strain CCMP3234" /NCGR_SAMPLE_ID=MMETSP1450 /ASSEMBLY_ACC=CAM_ASM_001115 /LENGTH=338 /DNA_ID=CAMNT_0044024473 /DNA_START=62 /DNA_END=1075 /DNA_ORIENTATION=-
MGLERGQRLPRLANPVAWVPTSRADRQTRVSIDRTPDMERRRPGSVSCKLGGRFGHHGPGREAWRRHTSSGRTLSFVQTDLFNGNGILIDDAYSQSSLSSFETSGGSFAPTALMMSSSGSSGRPAGEARASTTRLFNITARREEEVLKVAHGAVRKELCGLRVMVESLQKRKARTILQGEMHQFFTWFDQLESLLADYFQYEDQELFPWCQAHGIRLPQRFYGPRREAFHRTLGDLSACITRCRWHAPVDPDGVATTLSGVAKLSERFSSIILQHLTNEGEWLGEQTRPGFTSSFVQETLRSVWMEFGIASDDPGRFLAFSLGGIEDPEERKRFENEW